MRGRRGEVWEGGQWSMLGAECGRGRWHSCSGGPSWVGAHGRGWAGAAGGRVANHLLRQL